MALLIVFIAAAAGPLLAQARYLVAGMLSLVILLSVLTVWGMAAGGNGDAEGARYAAAAIAGLIGGGVVRLAIFVWKASAEDRALRRQLPRELPERHR